MPSMMANHPTSPDVRRDLSATPISFWDGSEEGPIGTDLPSAFKAIQRRCPPHSPSAKDNRARSAAIRKQCGRSIAAVHQSASIHPGGAADVIKMMMSENQMF